MAFSREALIFGSHDSVVVAEPVMPKAVSDLTLYHFGPNVLISSRVQNSTIIHDGTKEIVEDIYLIRKEATLAFFQFQDGYVQVTASSIRRVKIVDGVSRLSTVQVPIEMATLLPIAVTIDCVYDAALIAVMLQGQKQLEIYSVDVNITRLYTVEMISFRPGDICMSLVGAHKDTFLLVGDSAGISVSSLRSNRTTKFYPTEEGIVHMRGWYDDESLCILAIDGLGTLWHLVYKLDKEVPEFKAYFTSFPPVWYTSFAPTPNPGAEETITIHTVDEDNVSGVTFMDSSYVMAPRIGRDITMDCRMKADGYFRGTLIASGPTIGSSEIIGTMLIDLYPRMWISTAAGSYAKMELIRENFLVGGTNARGCSDSAENPTEVNSAIYIKAVNGGPTLGLTCNPWIRTVPALFGDALIGTIQYPVLLRDKTSYLGITNCLPKYGKLLGAPPASLADIELIKGIPATIPAIVSTLQCISEYWLNKDALTDGQLSHHGTLTMGCVYMGMMCLPGCPRIVSCLIRHMQTIVLVLMGNKCQIKQPKIEQDIAFAKEMEWLDDNIKCLEDTPFVRLFRWRRELVKEWMFYMDHKKNPSKLKEYALLEDRIPSDVCVSTPDLWEMALLYRRVLFNKGKQSIMEIGGSGDESKLICYMTTNISHNKLGLVIAIIAQRSKHFSSMSLAEISQVKRIVNLYLEISKDLNGYRGNFLLLSTNLLLKVIVNLKIVNNDVVAAACTKACCHINPVGTRKMLPYILRYYRNVGNIVDGYRNLRISGDVVRELPDVLQSDLAQFLQEGKRAQQAVIDSLLVDEKDEKSKKSQPKRKPKKKAKVATQIPVSTVEVLTPVPIPVQVPAAVEVLTAVPIVPTAKPWKTIGRISLIGKPIGLGSHGTLVYKGTWDNRIPCAVKVLQLVFWPAANAEIDALLKTWTQDAPNSIIRYYGREVDDIEDRLYLALELCDGTLTTAIKTGTMATSQLKLQAMQSIATAVEFLHRCGIAHNDITPQNVLVKGMSDETAKMNGGSITFKLTDLGISKDTGSDDSFTFTSTTPVGSGGFHPVEVLLRQPKSSKVDIFSLGVVFCYILTQGKNPFGNQPATAISHREAPSLDGLSPTHSHLLESMLNHDPAKRPSINQVLAHPALKSATQIQAFLHEVSNIIEADSTRSKDLEKKLVTTGIKNWACHFPQPVWEYITNARSYNQTSVVSLLRAIRNWTEHYDEAPLAVRQLFGDQRCDIIHWLDITFPTFIVGIWLAVE